MNVVIIGLLVLAALSLGLRTTSFLAQQVKPPARMVLAIIVGAILSAAFLEYCDRNRVFEFGLGLLLSLSPVGVFDTVKWWFRWGR